MGPFTIPDGAEEPEHGLNSQDRSAIEALPQGSALLIVRKGPNLGARFLLDADRTVVGRHPNSEIFLDDVTVSRKHAAFVRESEGIVVRDLGSLNGTYVGRERVDEALLQPGQEVQIGKYRLTFHPPLEKG
ncbi:MAG: FHA domain-containing protein [Brachybacterium sp.]|nr:FHA domain-containing protein [Brachybacterium sp.]